MFFVMARITCLEELCISSVVRSFINISLKKNCDHTLDASVTPVIRKNIWQLIQTVDCCEKAGVK